MVKKLHLSHQAKKPAETAQEYRKGTVRESTSPVNIDPATYKKKDLFPQILRIRAFKTFFLLVAIFLILLIWFLNGFFIVHSSEIALVVHLGKYEKILKAGIHWAPPFLDKVSITKIYPSQLLIEEKEYLTKDKKLVIAKMQLDYKVTNPRLFFLYSSQPLFFLHTVFTGAIYNAISNHTLEELLKKEPEMLVKLHDEVMAEINSNLLNSNPGIEILGLTIESVHLPEEISVLEKEILLAKEDALYNLKEAKDYRDKILQDALEKKEAMLKEANDYREEVVSLARKNAAEYLAIQPVYMKSPELVRNRLYLQTIASILANNSVYILDIDNHNDWSTFLDDFIKRTARNTTFRAEGQNMSDEVVSNAHTEQTELQDKAAVNYLDNRSTRLVIPDRYHYPERPSYTREKN